jgi:hypothetical protein
MTAPVERIRPVLSEHIDLPDALCRHRDYLKKDRPSAFLHAVPPGATVSSAPKKKTGVIIKGACKGITLKSEDLEFEGKDQGLMDYLLSLRASFGALHES